MTRKPDNAKKIDWKRLLDSFQLTCNGHVAMCRLEVERSATRRAHSSSRTENSFRY
jgi:hypothetical protein